MRLLRQFCQSDGFKPLRCDVYRDIPDTVVYVVNAYNLSDRLGRMCVHVSAAFLSPESRENEVHSQTSALIAAASDYAGSLAYRHTHLGMDFFFR